MSELDPDSRCENVELIWGEMVWNEAVVLEMRSTAAVVVQLHRRQGDKSVTRVEVSMSPG